MAQEQERRELELVIRVDAEAWARVCDAAYRAGIPAREYAGQLLAASTEPQVTVGEPRPVLMKGGH